MRTTIMIAATIALAGCSSIPKGLPPTPVRATEVVTAIHCEYQRALGDSRIAKLFSGRVAGALLTLKVTNTASGTPGLTFKPAVSTGKLALSGSTTFSDTGSRQMQLRDIVPLEQLASAGSVDAPCPGDMGSGLGIAAAMLELAETDSVDSFGSVILDETNLTITFAATRSVDGGIVFESTFVNAAVNQSKVSRVLDNTIAIVFKLPPKPAAAGGAARTAAPVERQINEALDRLDRRTIQIRPGDSVEILE